MHTFIEFVHGLLLLTQIPSYWLCLEKKFLKHLTKWGKSEKNQRRRSESMMCGTLTSSSVTPNLSHIERFQDAPSDATASTLKPDFSMRMMHSITSWYKIAPDALPKLRKHPNVCTHLSLKGWNMKTNAWSPLLPTCCFGVYFPKFVKPSIWRFLRLKVSIFEIFISSNSKTPVTNTQHSNIISVKRFITQCRC